MDDLFKLADIILTIVAMKAIIIGSPFDFFQWFKHRSKYVKAYDEWMAQAPKLP